jgi:hypothetical protein
MRLATLLLFSLLLTGCTFRAPQVEGLLRMVRGGQDIDDESVQA